MRVPSQGGAGTGGKPLRQDDQSGFRCHDAALGPQELGTVMRECEAGFSPLRWPSAVAASSTASMRWRTRLAVSGFVFQIGSRTRTTSPASICWTGKAPRRGWT
jgi:hypothetical protein